MIIYLNGKYAPAESAMVNANDAGLLFGHGVYETLRTYNGKLKYVSEHCNRLKASADALQIPFLLTETELEEALGNLVQKNSKFSGDDLRLRITLTAGSTNFVNNHKGNPALVITAAAIDNSERSPIILASYLAERPAAHIKSTSMITSILAQKYAREQRANEAIFINHNNEVTEGSFCNIFIVKSSVLNTPADNILEGITRGIVLDIAKDIVPIKERAINLDEMLEADEVFITSTVRGVVPAAQIDDKKFNAPGNFTQKISEAYINTVFGNGDI